MEDPNIIATLIPIDSEKRAENAFRLSHNHGHFLPPTGAIAEGPAISSRDPTPAREVPADDGRKYESTNRIRLTFHEKPKDPSRGYSFGTNPRACDVLLGHRGTEGAHGISGLHFCITFNEEQRLVLKDSSTHGTSVSYSGQAKDEVRHHFTWILDLKKDEGKWDVEVHVPSQGGLAFKVELASHDTCKAEYNTKVKKFLDESRTALPLEMLGIYSHTTTAQLSQSLTPRRHPIYISEQKLGGGSFGTVDKVIDVSTGAEYARKQFYEPVWRRDERRRKQQEQDWLKGICREIRIMRDNPHEHTVQVVDFREERSPFLVMPYFALGNLEELHSESPIAVEETIDLLWQALKALAYLHSRGVAHRDLKPQNILIKSRDPFSIKLADFGLANDKSDLETLCGTRLYTAPEIFLNRKYTTSVDLWSLGVIVLQYVYGLPRTVRTRRGKHKDECSMIKEWGLTWCHRIVNHLNNWESDDLAELLTIGMLQMKPEDRLSAVACVQKGYDLGLFDAHFIGSESTTPTRQTALQGGISDGDGDGSTTVTIIPGALWGTEETSKYDDNASDNGRTRCYNPKQSSRDLEHCTIRGNNIQAPENLLSCPLEARSRNPEGYKRQRSPAGGSINHFSSRGQIKRRQSNVRRTGRSYLRAYDLSGPCFQYDGESRDHIRTMYEAVLAFLTDLRLGASESQDIDDHTRTRVGDLCECLARLGITGMSITQTDLSDRAIITAISNSRRTVLARLTSSELMSPTADLAAHLLHMLQFQTPQLRTTLRMSTGDTSTDKHSRSWMVDDVDNQMTVPSAQQNGLTYPSALLDVTNISGCSMPISSRS
ncbi:MAG: hypothetical protein M1816_004724 [Peltula sp. TS41687]|nr:MAG: hypothetical protein M1816_004724 [Peltula sp. TS41687]